MSGGQGSCLSAACQLLISCSVQLARLLAVAPGNARRHDECFVFMALGIRGHRRRIRTGIQYVQAYAYAPHSPLHGRSIGASVSTTA
jgi:hypothetical protein